MSSKATRHNRKVISTPTHGANQGIHFQYRRLCPAHITAFIFSLASLASHAEALGELCTHQEGNACRTHRAVRVHSNRHGATYFRRPTVLPAPTESIASYRGIQFEAEVTMLSHAAGCILLSAKWTHSRVAPGYVALIEQPLVSVTHFLFLSLL